jgi:hypothetical protein
VQTLEGLPKVREILHFRLSLEVRELDGADRGRQKDKNFISKREFGGQYTL